MYNPIEHKEIWYQTGNISYWYDLITTWVTSYFVYLYETFREYPFVIKVAIVSIIVSIIIGLYNFVLIIYRARRRKKRLNIKNRLRKRYGDGIAYMLSEDSKPKMTRDEVLEALDLNDNDKPAQLLKTDLERITFCRLLYSMRISKQTVEGRSSNIKMICSIFDLQSFLERMVNHGADYMRVECLRIMWAFRLPVNAWIGNQMKDNRHNRIRRVVTYATMAASARSDLDYFDSEYFAENCCAYDEIQLGYTLQQRRSAGQKIPDLAHWVHVHKSPQVQCIFIRLMRKFDLVDSCPDLEELFQTTHDSQLVKEIARTWGYLHYKDGEKLMADALFMQSEENKIVILHALTRMHTGKSLDTIINTYQNSISQKVRLEALRCLYNYGDEGKKQFALLEQQAEGNDQKLFEFFHNNITMKQLYFRESDNDQKLYENNMFSVK